MKEDKRLETMNIISERKHVQDFLAQVDDYLGPKTHDKSRRYAFPGGYWTLEVFYQGMTLIPEEQVSCDVEPQLDEETHKLCTIGGGNMYWTGKPHWKKLTVGYTAFGDNVGGTLISDWEELVMVHNATAELTYWLGVDNPDRTWNLKDWTVVNFSTSPTKSAMLGVDLTFMFSAASLTRY